MAVLGRDDILGADDLETRRVECPKWGGTVLLQEMTAATYEEFEENVVTAKRTCRGSLRSSATTFVRSLPGTAGPSSASITRDQAAT